MLFNLSHTITILICWGVGYSLGHIYELLAIGIGYFIGREIAQAEYRWINTYGKGLRSNMSWWNSLSPKVWDVHSWFWNLLLPIISAIIIIGLK